MSMLFRAKVVSNTPAPSGIYNLVMEEPGLAELAQPGQFVNIRVSGSTAPLLRRPISIHWVDGIRVEILFQVVGQGTELLAQVRPGDTLDVQGPLGRGFQPGEGRPVLVGGGMGIAPLGFLAQSLTGREVTCLLGARNGELLGASGGDRLMSLGMEVIAATDDGSLGHQGLVTELLAKSLPENAFIYACGPKPMLRAVAGLALDKGLPCQVSLEEHMGCGVGACLGCVCKGVSAGKETYKRVCINGPVFDVREVSWE